MSKIISSLLDNLLLSCVKLKLYLFSHKVRCPTLPELQNGTLTTGGFGLGGVAKYQCHPGGTSQSSSSRSQKSALTVVVVILRRAGYRLEPSRHGAALRVCSSLGNWEPQGEYRCVPETIGGG